MAKHPDLLTRREWARLPDSPQKTQALQALDEIDRATEKTMNSLEKLEAVLSTNTPFANKARPLSQDNLQPQGHWLFLQ